ncbi:uncharacterized protein CLUP02_14583 [Colletotrichum lupini]|uniref:Uncharacterized protein n=1 Tax=Colletotrichum lupini TaxID=145971 RepID=A0A9Q8T4U4_9PEZI|nr:uncharacterized protein CLUP02_14583 [Colletotrichum lupini]UQC89055.1 hypothetical protein CLUP02_14583 [Colletotrichum lupini]
MSLLGLVVTASQCHGKLATITLCNELKLLALVMIVSLLKHHIDSNTVDNLTVLIAATDRPVPCIPAHPTVPTCSLLLTYTHSSPAFVHHETPQSRGPSHRLHIMSHSLPFCAVPLRRGNTTSKLTTHLPLAKSYFTQLLPGPPSNPPDSLLCGLRLACRFEDTLLLIRIDSNKFDTCDQRVHCRPPTARHICAMRTNGSHVECIVLPSAVNQPPTPFPPGLQPHPDPDNSTRRLRSTLTGPGPSGIQFSLCLAFSSHLRKGQEIARSGGPGSPSTVRRLKKYQEPEKSTSIFRVRRITYPKLQRRNRRAYSSRSPRHDLHIAAAGATHSRRASRAVYLQDLCCAVLLRSKRAYQYPVRSTSYMTTQPYTMKRTLQLLSSEKLNLSWTGVGYWHRWQAAEWQRQTFNLRANIRTEAECGSHGLAHAFQRRECDGLFVSASCWKFALPSRGPSTMSACQFDILTSPPRALTSLTVENFDVAMRGGLALHVGLQDVQLAHIGTLLARKARLATQLIAWFCLSIVTRTLGCAGCPSWERLGQPCDCLLAWFLPHLDCTAAKLATYINLAGD